jgi:PAS domain S-box-containing protein
MSASGLVVRELVALRERVAQLERQLSDRTRMVQALRESEEGLRQVMEHIPGAQWVYDNLTAQRAYVSRDYEEIWGRSLEALGNEATEWLDAIHPEDRAKFGEAVSALSGGSSLDETYRIVRPDGAIRWIHDRGYPIREESGESHRVVGTSEDITERREREQRRGEAERKWRDLVASTPDSMAELDLDGRVTFANRATAGFEVGTRLGSTLNEFLPPEQRDSFGRAVGEAVRTGEPLSFETRLALPAGNRWWLTRITPLRRGGRVVSLLAIASDITHRKEQQEAAAQRRKLESLDLLAERAAHSFNNLLTAILGNSDLALTDLPPKSPARRRVVEVEKAAERAAALADQLATCTGVCKGDRRPVNLSELIQGMAASLSGAVPADVGLELVLSADADVVEANAAQIRQIVMNLVSNAADAIGSEQGEITVRTGLMLMDRVYLVTAHADEGLSEGVYGYVTVSDTGAGMDGATVSRVCDPFFTTKPHRQGMGLATVLGFVRGHKGALKIDSQLGRGTTVIVLLPLSERPSTRIDPQQVKPDPPSVSETAPPRGTVLIAEDDETVRAVAKSALEQAGFEVLVARDGRQAVSVFREHSSEIDLVLLDLAMPRMRGEEALREIRSVRSDAPIVLTSGYSQREIGQRFKGHDLAGFLQKPYRHAALLREVHRAIGGEGDDPPH